MNSLRDLFSRFSLGQRFILAAVAIGVGGGLYWFTEWNNERDFKPLFTGMAAEDAGTLTAKLKELNVEYRLNQDGATILIPSARLAEVRLQLAAAGLPSTGRIGFELFDKTNFGASEFSEQINYQRAMEGELQRSVMSIREVENARVHITPAKDSIYLESRQPAKASVLVKLKKGAMLSQPNVQAICQLAASAVPGLAADQVSVLDTDGNLLNRPRPTADDAQGNEATLEYRKSVERELQNKIAATLDPLLGSNHFRTSVSADVDLTSGDQSEEIYDPNKSVMVSSQKTEDGPSGVQAASGTPGTASNVPNPTGRAASGASATSYARKTENVTFQTSRVVKHTKVPQGGVKKLSVSILVDHTFRFEGAKKIVEAPSAEKLKVIKDVVTATVGLNTERGDQLVVETFPFEATLLAEPLGPPPPAKPPPPAFQIPPWLAKLIEQKGIAMVAGIGGGILVVLLATVVWLLKRRGKKKKIAAESAAAAIEGKGADASRQMEAILAGNMADKDRKNAEAMASLKAPETSTKKTDILKKHIAEEVMKNPQGMTQIIRSWLNGEYQR